jgi:hypothetical protein
LEEEQEVQVLLVHLVDSLAVRAVQEHLDQLHLLDHIKPQLEELYLRLELHLVRI